MTRLYVVRHGEATGDGADARLSPLGRPGRSLQPAGVNDVGHLLPADR